MCAMFCVFFSLLCFSLLWLCYLFAKVCYNSINPPGSAINISVKHMKSNRRAFGVYEVYCIRKLNIFRYCSLLWCFALNVSLLLVVCVVGDCVRVYANATGFLSLIFLCNWIKSFLCYGMPVYAMFVCVLPFFFFYFFFGPTVYIAWIYSCDMPQFISLYILYTYNCAIGMASTR